MSSNSSAVARASARVGSALGLDHVAGLSEQQRERLPDIGVVLNDQQPHRFTRVW